MAMMLLVEEGSDARALVDVDLFGYLTHERLREPFGPGCLTGRSRHQPTPMTTEREAPTPWNPSHHASGLSSCGQSSSR